MTSREKYEYWLEAALYDLETAKAMLNAGRYVYVTFMCQQTIEKMTKGIYQLFTDSEPPMVHNIWNILKQLKKDITLENYFSVEMFEEKLTEYKSFFVELLSYYISGRYPSFKEKISTSIDVNRAKRVLNQGMEVFEWLESLSQYKK
ncbi:HEPN domain-containing protein [Paradesulfitobacterium aromaticivorans]